VHHNHELDVPRQTRVVTAEVHRKLIHLAGSLIAAAVMLRVSPGLARGILSAAAVMAALIEVARHLSPRGNLIFNSTFATLLRTHERKGVTGATTLAIGFVLAAFVAPPTIAAAGILMAGIGDSAAALVGKHFGRFRFAGGKSLQGSAACFAAAFIVALLIPGVPPVAALAGALLTTLFEVAVTSFDDNLILPLSAALIIWAFTGS
jgi:dolichol kinase